MPIQQFAPEYKPSPARLNSFDWKKVTTILAGIRRVVQGGGEAGSTAAPAANLDAHRTRMEPALVVLQQEFDKQLGPISQQVSLFNWIVIPLSGLAIGVGACLLALSAVTALKITGGVLSGGGFTALLVSVSRGLALGRQQAFFRLLPATYRSLIAMARTPAQYDFVFEAFARETLALRTESPAGGPASTAAAPALAAAAPAGDRAAAAAPAPAATAAVPAIAAAAPDADPATAAASPASAPAAASSPDRSPRESVN